MSALPDIQTPRQRWELAVSRYRLFYPNPTPTERRDVDWMRFPPLAAVYGNLVTEPENLPPTPDVFEAAAYEQPGLSRSVAVTWRLLAKFYPSFVAQQHLTLILLERFRHVTWSVREDLAGIDIHLSYQKLAIGVASAIAGRESKRWERVKAGRTPVSEDVWLLRLYREPYRYVVGPFWLHHPDDVEQDVKAFVASLKGS